MAADTHIPLFNTDVLKVFDAVSAQNGFEFGTVGAGHGGEAGGSAGGGDARITFSSKIRSVTGWSFGQKAVHEIMHVATDKRMYSYGDVISVWLHTKWPYYKTRKREEYRSHLILLTQWRTVGIGAIGSSTVAGQHTRGDKNNESR